MTTTIDTLLKQGFERPSATIPRRLVACISGMQKTGKTHLALTAQRPIVYFNLDAGDEGVIQQFLPTNDIIQYNVHIPEGERQKVYETLWADLTKRIDTALQLPSGTVVIDTASEAYELSRLAEFGKLSGVKSYQYGEVYREWRKIIDGAYSSKLNVIFIHTLKPRYVNDKRTEEYDVNGYNQMEFISQINIRTYRMADPTTGRALFSARVIDCRHYSDFNGLALPVSPLAPDTLNFTWLVNTIHDAMPRGA